MCKQIVYIYTHLFAHQSLQSLPGIAVILISLIFILKFYNVNSHLTAESCGIIIHYSWKKKQIVKKTKKMRRCMLYWELFARSKKNSRKHHRMAISFRSLLPSIGTCRCIICCDSEKRSFIKIQLDFGDALLYMYHNTCFIGVYRIIQNILQTHRAIIKLAHS